MEPFELPQQTARVSWEDGSELHGLEAVFSLDTPMDFLYEIQLFEWDKDVGELPEDERKTYLRDQRRLLTDFGDNVLVEWNAHKRGAPVPPTGEGMMRAYPPRLLGYLVTKWSEVIAAVPLEPGSTDTDGSEGSLPKTGT